MENKFKICPTCNAEFFSHVEKCNVCEVALVWSGELEKIKAETTREVEKLEVLPENFVAFEEGPLEILREICVVLGSMNVPFELQSIKDEERISKKHTSNFTLFVPQEAVESARKEVEAYWAENYPELNKANENLAKGLCPACGALAVGLTECPDCGLNLEAPQNAGDSGCGPCSSC